MVKLTEATEVYKNSAGYLVVQDPKNPKLWRRVNEDGETATMFAGAPPPGSKPIARPEPVQLQTAAEVPAESLIEDIKGAVQDVAEQVEAIPEEVRRLIDKETETLNETLQRVEVEKNTVISDLQKELRDKERDSAAQVSSLEETIRRLNQELEAEKNIARADPSEIDRLKREIARLTAEYNDSVRALQADVASATSAASATTADLGRRDARIAELEGLLQQERQKPQPAPRRQSLYASWRTSSAVTRVAYLLLALLLLLWLGGGVRFWFGSPRTTSETIEVVKEVKPADYDSIKKELADSKAKIKTAQDDKARADAALADAKREAADAKAAQQKAESQLAEAQRQRPSVPAVNGPTAPPVVPPLVQDGRGVTGRDLFKIDGTPPGYRVQTVNEPDKAGMCQPPRRLYRTNQCYREAGGSITCKLDCR